MTGIDTDPANWCRITETVGAWRTWFPCEPDWWRDGDAGDRRRVACREFTWSDLAVLIDDVIAHAEPAPVTVEEVAALARRCFSLAWLTEVAAVVADESPSTDSLEGMIRYWMLRAARAWVDLSWRVVMELPADLAEAGVGLAREDRSEVIDHDD